MWKGTIDGYKTNEIILQMNKKSDISTYKYMLYMNKYIFKEMYMSFFPSLITMSDFKCH